MQGHLTDQTAPASEVQLPATQREQLPAQCTGTRHKHHRAAACAEPCNTAEQRPAHCPSTRFYMQSSCLCTAVPHTGTDACPLPCHTLGQMPIHCPAGRPSSSPWRGEAPVWRGAPPATQSRCSHASSIDCWRQGCRHPALCQRRLAVWCTPPRHTPLSGARLKPAADNSGKHCETQPVGS